MSSYPPHAPSGAHPFRPQCLLEAYPVAREDGLTPGSVADIAAAVTHGDCPRCGRSPRARFKGDPGASSRVTRCRCVPICAPCGDHELLDTLEQDGLGNHPLDWAATPTGWLDDEAVDTALALRRERQRDE